MELKKLYEINETNIYDKFNFLFMFSFLQFFAIIFLGFILVAAIINNLAVFVSGFALFLIGSILVVTKYILNRFKIKILKTELPEPPKPVEEIKTKRKIFT